MKISTKDRESEFELMRLLCMLMILSLHVNKDILFSYENEMLIFNKILMYIVESLSIVAVNCFVLITGYFSVSINQFRFKKVADLIVLTSVYGIVIYFIMVIIGNCEFSINLMIECTIPYLYDKVWFINIYAILIMLSPFVNKCLGVLSKREYKLLLAIIILLFSVWPSFLTNPPEQDKGYGIISFLMMYIIGGYIKLHVERSKTRWSYLTLYFVFCIATFATATSGFLDKYWFSYNSVFIIGASVSLFMVFRSFKIKSVKINYISQSVIAVYLIHAHQLIRPHIFIEWFCLQEFLGSYYFFFVYICAIIGVFIFCLFIDVLRRIAKQIVLNMSNVVISK